MSTWGVLISEQRKQGHGHRTEHTFHGRTYRTRDDARSAARRIAQNHEARQPRFPRGRTIVRVGSNRYIVMVRGAAGGVYTFEVTVCELLSVDD